MAPLWLCGSLVSPRSAVQAGGESKLPVLSMKHALSGSDCCSGCVSDMTKCGSRVPDFNSLFSETDSGLWAWRELKPTEENISDTFTETLSHSPKKVPCCMLDCRILKNNVFLAATMLSSFLFPIWGQCTKHVYNMHSGFGLSDQRVFQSSPILLLPYRPSPLWNANLKGLQLNVMME